MVSKNRLCLVYFAVLCMFSCETRVSQSDTIKIQRKVLRVNLDENIQSLFPPEIKRTSDEFVGQLIYEGLFMKDHLGMLEKRLIEAVNYDSLTKTFHLSLYPGIKFHDGSPLTSRDVYQCFKVLFDMAEPENPSVLRFRDGVLGYSRYAIRRQYGVGQDSVPSGFQIHDKRNLSITWNGSGREFKSLLSQPAFWIYKKTGDRNGAIGTGPFQLEYANADISYSLRRNTDWQWGNERGEAPYLDGVSIRFIKNQDAKISEFLNTSLDILELQSGHEVPTRTRDLTLLDEASRKYGNYRKLAGCNVTMKLFRIRNIYNVNLREIIRLSLMERTPAIQDSIEHFVNRFFPYAFSRKIQVPMINRCNSNCVKAYTEMRDKLGDFLELVPTSSESLNPNAPYIVLEERLIAAYDKKVELGFLPSSSELSTLLLDDNEMIVVMEYYRNSIYSDTMIEGFVEYSNWGMSIPFVKFKQPRVLSMNE